MVTKTVIQAVHYLLSKLGPTDKIKIIKLLYLADKYHLMKYGRLITGDEYYAMEHGPVGSATKDVFCADYVSFPVIELSTANLIKQVKEFTFEAEVADIEYDMLSDSDIEAIDFIIGKFGNTDKWVLRNYTHKYPEWKQFEDLFNNHSTSREDIKQIELFSKIDESFQLDEEQISTSREIFEGKLS